MAKKLYRSRSEKVIAGVCGGIGDYFDVDPTLIRLAFILIFFLEGVGLLAYILGWIIIPLEPIGNNNQKLASGQAEKEREGSGDESSEKAAPKQENNGEESSGTDNSQKESPETFNKRRILGGVLVAVGVVFLAERWFSLFYLEQFWPLLLIGIGGLIIFKEVKNHE